MVMSKSQSALDEGKRLARELYDLELRELKALEIEGSDALRAKYRRLSATQFEDILTQVIESKQLLQEQVGWQAIPHDIAVLVLVLVTLFFDLRTAIIACVATLVLLEGIFQFFFHRKLNRVLSKLVWFTYPAYLLFAYLLYQTGVSFLWIALAVILAWGGTFILGMFARLPIRLILQRAEQGRREAIDKRKMEEEG
jgi:hypothetical protein